MATTDSRIQAGTITRAEEARTRSEARCTHSVAHAAIAAGVSRRTIYNWLKGGKLDWERTAGGSVRINPESLWEGYDGPRRAWEVRR